MCAKKFLSTPSARRATIISSIIVLPLSISIHALREEGDIVHGIGESLSFISIHALREEGDAHKCPHCAGLHISIHALREEGDVTIDGAAEIQSISIHALREEGDARRR